MIALNILLHTKTNGRKEFDNSQNVECAIGLREVGICYHCQESGMPLVPFEAKLSGTIAEKDCCVMINDQNVFAANKICSDSWNGEGITCLCMARHATNCFRLKLKTVNEHI